MVRISNITKLSLINFFTNLFFLSPVVVFFYQQRGLNYFQILALESVLVLSGFLFEIPTGIFADKFGKKISVILGVLLMAVEPIIFLFAESFLLFAASFAIYGVGLAFLSGTIEAMIYDSLKAERKQHLMKKAMGSFGSASLLAMVVAPVIGSYIARDLLMPQFIFNICLTIGAGIIGVLLSLMLKDSEQKKAGGESPIELLKEGINLLRGNRKLLRIALLSIFTSPFFYEFHYLYQPYLKMSGVEVALFGIIFSAALLLSALLRKYAYTFEKLCGMKRAILLATLLPGLLYLAMAFVFHPLFAVVLFVANVSVMQLQAPLFSDYKNKHIPARIRATALSLICTLGSAYVILMRLLIGWLADINLSYSFLLMGSVIILAALALRIDETHVGQQSSAPR